MPLIGNTQKQSGQFFAKTARRHFNPNATQSAANDTNPAPENHSLKAH